MDDYNELTIKNEVDLLGDTQRKLREIGENCGGDISEPRIKAEEAPPIQTSLVSHKVRRDSS